MFATTVAGFILTKERYKLDYLVPKIQKAKVKLIYEHESENVNFFDAVMSKEKSNHISTYLSYINSTANNKFRFKKSFLFIYSHIVTDYNFYF